MIKLLLLSLASGTGHIISDHHKHYPSSYLLKPLTVLLIVLAVLMYSIPGHYTQLIILGLLLSLAGDIFLMLKKQQFIAGLVSFLIAHIFYIAAFYNKIDQPIQWLNLAYFALPALLYFAYIYQGLGKLSGAVLVYIVTIVLMVFFSFEVYRHTNDLASLIAFGGAVTFMFSDATLAFNKFKKPFYWAQLMILSSYYLAQWGIAYSTFQ